MNIQSQVCTLEQAEKLYDLGIRYPNSPFRWLVSEKKKSPGECVRTLWGTRDSQAPSAVTHACILSVPALTVAELGQMLFMDANGTLPPGLWFIDREQFFPTTREAEFRARMLIYLLENNHITADEANNRLAQP